MRYIFILALLLITIVACKKSNLRNSIPPQECLIGKWQIKGQDPNTWHRYFREDHQVFTPSQLTSGTGFHWEATDSVIVISFYDAYHVYTEQRLTYVCYGDSMNLHNTALSTTAYDTHYFKYNGL